MNPELVVFPRSLRQIRSVFAIAGARELPKFVYGHLLPGPLPVKVITSWHSKPLKIDEVDLPMKCQNVHDVWTNCIPDSWLVLLVLFSESPDLTQY